MAKLPAPVIAIHGGAGTIDRARMTGRRERDLRAALTEALEAGYAVLDGGGDRAGNVATPFVSEGMYRGVMRKGKVSVAIY